jgi:hypothetical protein
MEVSGQLHAPASLSPGREVSYTCDKKAGWAPDPVWALWRGEEYLAPVRNSTPAVQPAAHHFTD